MKKTLFILVLIFLFYLPAISIDKEITRSTLISKVAELAKWCETNGEYPSQSILLTLQGSLIIKTDTLLVKLTAEYCRLMLQKAEKQNKSKI